MCGRCLLFLLYFLLYRFSTHTVVGFSRFILPPIDLHIFSFTKSFPNFYALLFTGNLHCTNEKHGLPGKDGFFTHILEKGLFLHNVNCTAMVLFIY